MERLTFSYPAGTRPAHRARVGVVASGDLEILAEPRQDGTAQVSVLTSVDGFEEVWGSVLTRFFRHAPLAVDLEINDCGATPGTAELRLAQVKELMRP